MSYNHIRHIFPKSHIAQASERSPFRRNHNKNLKYQVHYKLLKLDHLYLCIDPQEHKHLTWSSTYKKFPHAVLSTPSRRSKCQLQSFNILCETKLRGSLHTKCYVKLLQRIGTRNVWRILNKKRIFLHNINLVAHPMSKSNK